MSGQVMLASADNARGSHGTWVLSQYIHNSVHCMYTLQQRLRYLLERRSSCCQVLADSMLQPTQATSTWHVSDDITDVRSEIAG